MSDSTTQQGSEQIDPQAGSPEPDQPMPASVPDALAPPPDALAPPPEARAAAGEPAPPPDRPKKKKKKKKKEKEKKKEGDGTRLGSSRGIETMFRTSYRQHIDLSSLADTKANIMITINGIIVSVLLASISPKIDSNNWLLLPTSVLLLGCLMSMVFAILSARPRVSSRIVTLEDVRANQSNILFFGNFVNMSERDFLVGMEELLQNTDNLYNNMMRDIYGLGKVLKRKFELLRIAYNVFMISLSISIMLFIGVYMLVVFYGLGS
jgi:hypothetical protein